VNDIERLLAIEEIKKLKAKYCRCADMKDFVGYAEVFAEDAVSDIRNFAIARHPLTGEWIEDAAFTLEQLEALAAGIDWPLRGRDVIVGFAARPTNHNVLMIHNVFAPEIELTSETTARGTWQLRDDITFNDRTSPINGYRGAGYYHETYVRVDRRWFIQTVELTRLKMDFW
jgi:hypothetical protein